MLNVFMRVSLHLMGVPIECTDTPYIWTNRHLFRIISPREVTAICVTAFVCMDITCGMKQFYVFLFCRMTSKWNSCLKLLIMDDKKNTYCIILYVSNYVVTIECSIRIPLKQMSINDCSIRSLSGWLSLSFLMLKNLPCFHCFSDVTN